MSSGQLRKNATEPSAEAGAGPDNAVPENEQELRQEIEQTRERLGDTVQQLVAKTDVKARARAKAAGVTGRVKGNAALARSKAAGRGVDVRSQVAGKTLMARQKATARRDQLQARATGAWQTAPEGARRTVAKGASTARQHWMPLTAALLALGSVYFAVKWWNMRRLG
jgi:hypothetical protein